MASGRPDPYFETHWTGNNNSHMGEEYSSPKSLSSFVFSMTTKKRSMYWKQFSQLIAILIGVLYLIKVKSIETVSQRHFSWPTISPTLEACLVPRPTLPMPAQSGKLAALALFHRQMALPPKNMNKYFQSELIHHSYMSLSSTQKKALWVIARLN